ncbi:MAG: hypothetical protein IPL15_03895 [Comamonadaceae bacterium]|uniref:chemotaxis protein CheB n=1 Tax=Candidatus Skiveiella danica TaxID=3386177 RepID=UPI00390BB53E|nr:hypothetical protein [Comamonadaceae bacterium]
MNHPPARDFPIVCVGGSAGGLDAYIRLLEHLPADMGVAIVIVNHITIMPTQLHEVLPHFTRMPSSPRLRTAERASIRPAKSLLIVSGYDGDGAAALCGIREVGGITIAQKPRQAPLLSPEDRPSRIAHAEA